MKEVKRRCEAYLMKKKVTPDLLIKAQNYSLPGLKKKCVEVLKTRKYTDLEKEEGFFDQLNTDLHVLLLHDRIKHIETKAAQERKMYEQSQNTFREVVDLFGELQEAVAKKQNKKTIDQVIDVCDDVLDILKKYDPNKSECGSESSKGSKGEVKKGGWK